MAASEVCDLYICQYKDRISISFSFIDMKEFVFTYDFDKENSEKLIAALQKKWQGSLEQMVREGFLHKTVAGELFQYLSLEEFCQKHDIQYKSVQDLII